MINFNILSKYSLFVFVFLFPFLFLTADLLIAKVFLTSFVLLMFIFQLIESFKSKKYLIPKNLLIVFLFSLFLSSAFSKNVSISFFQGNDSFFFIFSLFLIFVFAKNLLKRKEDTLLFIGSLCFSLVIVSAVFISEIIGNNVYGLIEPLSILIATTLGISLYCIFSRERRFEIIIYSIFSFVYFCALIMIGFNVAWFVASLFAFFVFWKQARENDFSFNKRRVVFSLISFLLLFVLFLTPKFINNSVTLSSPISMSDSSLVSFSSLLSNAKSFVFGSGPGTFSYEYAKILIPFPVDQGASGFLTILSDAGFLSFIIFSFVFILFAFKGIKRFLKSDSETEDIVFITTFVLFCVLIIFRIEIILFVLLFLFLGIYENFDSKDKIISFKDLSIIFAIFLIMAIYHFVFLNSERLFNEASKEFNSDINKAIEKTEKAARYTEKSDYYIGLSQFYLLKAVDIFENNWSLSEDIKEQKQENEKMMKAFISQAEVAAEKATSIDEYNYLVWQNLALIYENTSFLVNDNTDKALNALDKTIELSPKNYLAYYVKGRIYEESKRSDEALEAYKKAFSINPNYENVREKVESVD